MPIKKNTHNQVYIFINGERLEGVKNVVFELECISNEQFHTLEAMQLSLEMAIEQERYEDAAVIKLKIERI